jgi:hypothetical protein
MQRWPPHALDSAASAGLPRHGFLHTPSPSLIALPPLLLCPLGARVSFSSRHPPAPRRAGTGPRRASNSPQICPDPPPQRSTSPSTECAEADAGTGRVWVCAAACPRLPECQVLRCWCWVGCDLRGRSVGGVVNNNRRNSRDVLKHQHYARVCGSGHAPTGGGGRAGAGARCSTAQPAAARQHPARRASQRLAGRPAAPPPTRAGHQPSRLLIKSCWGPEGSLGARAGTPHVRAGPAHPKRLRPRTGVSAPPTPHTAADRWAGCKGGGGHHNPTARGASSGKFLAVKTTEAAAAAEGAQTGNSRPTPTNKRRHGRRGGAGGRGSCAPRKAAGTAASPPKPAAGAAAARGQAAGPPLSSCSCEPASPPAPCAPSSS